MPEQYQQERKGRGRRPEDNCPMEGCGTVVMIRAEQLKMGTTQKNHNFKLSLIIGMAAVILTLAGICATLLGTQQYQIPIVRAAAERADAAMDKRMSLVEAAQTADREFYKARVAELKELIQDNLVAIRKRPRPINQTIRTQEYYFQPDKTVPPARPYTAPPPTKGGELWKQK